MKLASPTDDHHWLALWVLLAGGILLSLTEYESTFAGVLMGAGFVWLMLVE
jgi:hypothetical protein